MEQDSFRDVALPAPALLPQFPRLEDRHLDLQATRAIHLLAHDGLDFPVGAQPERGQGVNARGDPPHHPRTAQKDVGDRLRIAGNLTDRLEEILRPTHLGGKLSVLSFQFSVLGRPTAISPMGSPELRTDH